MSFESTNHFLKLRGRVAAPNDLIKAYPTHNLGE